MFQHKPKIQCTSSESEVFPGAARREIQAGTGENMYVYNRTPEGSFQYRLTRGEMTSSCENLRIGVRTAVKIALATMAFAKLADRMEAADAAGMVLAHR